MKKESKSSMTTTSFCHFVIWRCCTWILGVCFLLTCYTSEATTTATDRPNKLLNAYHSPLKALASPNNYYFLEFPLDDPAASASVNHPSPMCGNGTPYSFLFKRGTDKHLNKLIIEFEGGPACWSDDSDEDDEEGSSSCCDAQATAAGGGRRRVQTPWEEYLQTSEETVLEGGYFPPLGSCTGITEGLIEYGAPLILGPNTNDIPICLRREDKDDYDYYNKEDDSNVHDSTWWENMSGTQFSSDSNIRDWSYILLPHCTLDWHLGYQSEEQSYTCGDDDQQVYHRGGINVEAVLNWIQSEFDLPLEALITVAGGKVGGCNNIIDVSSIAPLLVPSKLYSSNKGSAPVSPKSNSALVITEGGSLWKNLDSLNSLATSMATRWDAQDFLISVGDTGSTNLWLDFVEDTVKNIPVSTAIAWLGSSELGAEEGNGSASTNDALRNDELEWLNKLSATTKGNLQVYTPSEGSAVNDDFCPIYALPTDDSGPTTNKELSSYFNGFTKEMSWNRRSSSSSSSSPSSGTTLRSSSSNNGDDTNNDDGSPETKRSRLSFLSVCIIIFGLYVLAWIHYFVVKHYRIKHNISDMPKSPTDWWFIALTEYPGWFLGGSLIIPITLTILAVVQTSGGVDVNLDFASYLDISTYEEDVFQSYNKAQTYQRQSILVEDMNCAILSERATDFDNRLLEEQSSLFSVGIDLSSSSEMRTPGLLAPGGRQEHERELIQGYGEWYGAGQGITLIYTNRNGGNVFTPEALQQMRNLEESIIQFPGFEDYCFIGRGGQCDAMDSIVPNFFANGELIEDIDSVLRPLTQSVNAIWRMDQYFSPENLGSNMTKTFLWFRNVGGDQSAANDFLKSLYNDLWKNDLEGTYPDLVYTWEHPYLNDVESKDALNHDAAWSIASFVFIGLMIFLKVRNVFTFFFGMLGLALSFSTAYYWVSVHFALPQITLLHVSALFVMLGIGADDIFLMIDSFEHTKVEFSTACYGSNAEESCNSPVAVRQRMKSAYSKAGSMMLVSSLTTAVCFFSNAFGVVVVIVNFGIYMGMVVLVNYLHVMTILPSAMMVNELYVKPYLKSYGKSPCSPPPPPLPDVEGPDAQSEQKDEGDKESQDNGEVLDQTDAAAAAASISSKQLPSDDELADAQVNTGQRSSQNANENFLRNTSKMSRADRWFVENYAPFVNNRRFYIVLATIILALILGVVSIFTFAMNNGTIVIFTEKYNLGRLSVINEEYFNGDVQKTTETIYFDPTAGPHGGSSNYGGYGDYNGPGGYGSGTGSGSGGSGGAGDVVAPGTVGGAGAGAGAGGNSGNVGVKDGVEVNFGENTQWVDCVTCFNGGSCTELGTCTCLNGYGGADCRAEVCPNVNGTLCGDQGKCIPHPDGYEGATVCECDEGYGGKGCTIPLIAAVKRSDSITVKLVWGVEPEQEPSKLWVINNDEGLYEDTSIHRGIQSSFDVSEPDVQEWLYETVQRARNDTTLHVQQGIPTWIEIVRDYAMLVEDVGFPIPKELFIGYVQLLRARDQRFAILISDEIGTSSPGLAGDFLYASITFKADVLPSETSISEMKLEQWTIFTNSINQMKPTGMAPVLAQSQVFLTAHRTEATVDSTLSTWLISNVLCLGIILIFTQNLMLTFMVMGTIFLIFMCLGGLLFGVFAVPFGPIEALGVSIFIGLSANYSLHVVHAYHRSNYQERSEKVKEAIFVVGSPITASALSTIGGCIFLFACRTWAFKELGILICCVTAMALLYSMTFLLSWLAFIGPLPYELPHGSNERDEQHQNERHIHQYDILALCHRDLSLQTAGISSDTTTTLPKEKTDEDPLSTTHMVLPENLSDEGMSPAENHLSLLDEEDPAHEKLERGTKESKNSLPSSHPTTAGTV